MREISLLLIEISSIVMQLFSDLMSNFDNKLTIKIKLFSQAQCKILRRIINIIYIPLKSIFKAYVINFDIQLEYSQALLIFWFEGSMVAYCFFNCIDYLVLKGDQEGVLGYQQFDKLLRCQIWFISIPTKHLFVFFAVWLQLEMNGYQILFNIDGSLSFDVQSIWNEVEFFIDCFIEGCVSGFS